MKITVHPVSDLSPEQKKSKARIGKFLTKFLKAQGAKLAKQITAAYSQQTKADDPESKAEQIIAAANFEEWDVVADEIRDDLGGSFEQTAQIILGKLQVDSDSAFDLVNQRSVEYADEAAADLVTGITETTRDRLRELVAEAIDNAQGPDELSAAIQDDYLFSSDRADTIARTEIGNAHMEGALEGAKASGLELEKSIIRGSEEYDCDICGDNEDAGAIGLDEEFPSGDEAPLFHPNCECSLIFVVASGE